MQSQEKLQEILLDLQVLMKNDVTHFTPEMQRKAAMLIYQLESRFSNYREQLELVPLDGKFQSQSILDSFFEESEVDTYIHEVKPQLRTFWRPKDYQYSLLGFLLAFQHQIYGKQLHEVIQFYLDEFKNNLSYGDIEMTSSGRTRCDTNLRFAFKALQGMGLIREYKNLDDKVGNTWSLTLLGLLVTTSFLHIPATYEEKRLIFNMNLEPIKKLQPIVNIDYKIFERINDLSKNSFMTKMLQSTTSMLGYHVVLTEHRKLFKKGSPLFKEIVKQLDTLKNNKAKSPNKSLIDIVTTYEEKYEYNEYRYKLLLFDENFYQKIWQSINN